VRYKDTQRAESALSPPKKIEGLTQHISPLSLCDDDQKIESDPEIKEIKEEDDEEKRNEIESKLEQTNTDEADVRKQKELRDMFSREITPGLSITRTLKLLNKLAPTSDDYLEEFKTQNRSSKKKSIPQPSQSKTIDELIPIEKMQTIGSNDVLYEGSIQRYHPGFSVHFFTKWCQITKSYFLYYKTQNDSKLNCRPLFILPLEFIKEINIVDVDIPELRKTKTADLLHQSEVIEMPSYFEIFLLDGIDINRIRVDLEPSEDKLIVQELKPSEEAVLNNQIRCNSFEQNPQFLTTPHSKLDKINMDRPLPSSVLSSSEKKRRNKDVFD